MEYFDLSQYGQYMQLANRKVIEIFDYILLKGHLTKFQIFKTQYLSIFWHLKNT